MKIRAFLPILFLFVCFSTAQGQKTILIEKLTNAYCGACPNGSIVLDTLRAGHPNAILVKHHKPIDFDDNPLTNDMSGALWNDINVPGNPAAMIDRKIYNGDLIVYSGGWSNALTQTAATENEGEVRIEDLKYDSNTRMLNFTVKATLTEISTPGPFRLTAMVVEDNVWGQEQYSYFNNVPGHPLEGLGDIIWAYPHRDVVRDILEDHWGVADIIDDTPDPSVEYEYSFSYEIPESYKPDRMSLVATINQHGSTLSERKVLNATQVFLKNMGLGLTSSTDDLQQEAMVKIYPNPVRNQLQAEFSSIPEALFIYDSIGELIWNGKAESKYLLVDQLSLENGSYFLTAIVNGKKKVVPFIVLN